jgi:hypothetical protein
VFFIAFFIKKLYFKGVENNPLTTMSNPAKKQNKKTEKPTHQLDNRTGEDIAFAEQIEIDRTVLETRIKILAIESDLDLDIRRRELSLKNRGVGPVA